MRVADLAVPDADCRANAHIYADTGYHANAYIYAGSHATAYVHRDPNLDPFDELRASPSCAGGNCNTRTDYHADSRPNRNTYPDSHTRAVAYRGRRGADHHYSLR